MSLILAFDTSAAHCAAAVLSGDRILAARQEEMSRGQAERLLPLAEAVLAEAGAGWAALDALGVGVGPGNFTGIRISVSAARGLALALGVPALGVSLFEVLAQDEAGDLLAALPAPRDMVYLQALSRGRAVAAPLLADPLAPPPLPALPVLGHRAAEIAAAAGTTGREAAPGAIAERIARITAARLAEGAPAERPAPLYIRPADAAPPREAPPVLLP